MVAVLKRPAGSSKGILVFTHKERDLLDPDAPVVGSLIRRIRARYVLGMHWGLPQRDQPAFPHIDFHLASDSAVHFKPGVSARRIPLNSASFTPAVFGKRNVEKEWDIICVTRTATFKRNRDLLDTMRLLYDRRPQTRVLVVCSGPADLEAAGQDNGLWDHYVHCFKEQERNLFTFLYIRGGGYPFPMSRADIAFLYNASRIFTLFTDTEGESRVIKEAVLCGLPVVVRRELQGGGLDLLDDANSRLFSSLDEAANAYVEILEDYKKFRFDSEVLAREFSERHSVPRLRTELERLFSELSIPLEGELDLDDLSRVLPSHSPDQIPAALRSGTTADLGSLEAMALFLKMTLADTALANVSLAREERIRLQLWQTRGRAEKYLTGARRRLAMIVNRMPN